MGSGPAAGGEPSLSISTSVTTQHLLVRYAKRGKMRFASHLDVARAFERGVRRANLPIAYSAGFTPHPKISYAGGAPTGVATEAEYLSLTLTSRTEADAVRERLNAALPDGIDVIAVTEDSGGLPTSRLTASEWQIALPGLPPDNVVPVVRKFLALTEAPVERLTSKGIRRMDARAAVVSLDVCCLPGGRPVPPDVRASGDDRKDRDLITPARTDEELTGENPQHPPMRARWHEPPIMSGARKAARRAPAPGELCCAWSSGTPSRPCGRTTCSMRYATFPMCSRPSSR